MRRLAVDQLNTLTESHVHQAGNDQLFWVDSCPQPVPARQAAADAYEKIAECLARTGMQIVYERVFGNVSVEHAVMTAREKAFFTRAIMSDGPVTYIQGCPWRGRGFAGVIIHAVAAASLHDMASSIMDGSVYRERAAARGLDNFPAACVVVDVCREELLFEIDAEVTFVNSSSEVVQ